MSQVYRPGPHGALFAAGLQTRSPLELHLGDRIGAAGSDAKTLRRNG